MSFFHSKLMSLEFHHCSTCLECFPDLYMAAGCTECRHCNQDRNIPKLYSTADNMNPEQKTKEAALKEARERARVEEQERQAVCAKCEKRHREEFQQFLHYKKKQRRWRPDCPVPLHERCSFTIPEIILYLCSYITQ